VASEKGERRGEACVRRTREGHGSLRPAHNQAMAVCVRRTAAAFGLWEQGGAKPRADGLKHPPTGGLLGGRRGSFPPTALRGGRAFPQAALPATTPPIARGPPTGILPGGRNFLWATLPLIRAPSRRHPRCNALLTLGMLVFFKVN
jgi:hypothetical protein